MQTDIEYFIIKQIFCQIFTILYNKYAEIGKLFIDLLHFYESDRILILAQVQNIAFAVNKMYNTDIFIN